MFSISEQFSTAIKANFEAQLAMINALTGTALEGVTKVIELNVGAAKASAAESAVTAKQLLAAKDPQEFFALSAAQAQPNTEKALAYGRHLAAIASSTQAEITETTEAQIASAHSKVIGLLNEVAKNAPAGSESAIAILKSAFDNANAGYEQLTKTAKQAAEALETNLTTVTSQLSQTVEKAVEKTAKQNDKK
ncbi:phasin family protein [Collimonas antrihumi]|uniref:phasin family protein n=1 Tax=Collimonas antrihumi TaxID=1940615 RepID=UPI001B8B275C|nr:phasin family protein [Collimonas antrihumi]